MIMAVPRGSTHQLKRITKRPTEPMGMLCYLTPLEGFGNSEVALGI